MKNCSLITPQKKVNKSQTIDQNLKQFSPFVMTVISSSYGKFSKLQMLQSPLSANKDLFYQLLASQVKPIPQLTRNLEIFDESQQSTQLKQQKQYSFDHESQQFDQNESEDQNGIKKRKRKSTNQIKILKLELEIDTNWNKQKITQMSQITGLSQSQVYKWWWDQKKKNMKNEAQSHRMINKRKIIKKQFHHNYKSFKENVSDDQGVQTKAKQIVDIQQIPETEKKVNKRLIF